MKRMTSERQIIDHSTFFITADDIIVKLETPEEDKDEEEVITFSLNDLPSSLVADDNDNVRVTRKRKKDFIFNNESIQENNNSDVTSQKFKAQKPKKDKIIGAKRKPKNFVIKTVINCVDNSTAGEPKLLVCEVEGCQYSAKYYSLMKRHQTIHVDDRPFQCDKCDKRFKIKTSWKAHQNVHEGKRFDCPMGGCSVNYATKYEIRRHVQIFHMKDAPLLSCHFDFCDYRTYRRDCLITHRKVHSDKRPFKCDWADCGQTFKTNANFCRHKLMHQDKHRFKCSWQGCDYRTNHNQSLQRHQAFHTGKGQYSCEWTDCDLQASTLNSIVS